MLVATPPAPDDDSLELPTEVQHLALMVLVNVGISEDGARILRQSHSEMLQLLSDTAEDPRARSLAHTVLDNISQHAGLYHHLTKREAPGQL